MSVMHRGDEHLHYSDHSHRWIAPPDIDQAIWEAGMRAHMAQHRATMGGPFNIDELIEVPKARVPGRRDQVVELPKRGVPRQRRAA
ncbi:hypothetical protein ACTMTJ_26785 [Phytohabitans sp. LJ34]|uniref:hypothetical protein n=1 Tax=Phytohabitans sp. LJ34 TaxID=3452217 RepID=UPI003F8CCE0A